MTCSLCVCDKILTESLYLGKNTLSHWFLPINSTEGLFKARVFCSALSASVWHWRVSTSGEVQRIVPFELRNQLVHFCFFVVFLPLGSNTYFLFFFCTVNKSASLIIIHICRAVSSPHHPLNLSVTCQHHSVWTWAARPIFHKFFRLFKGKMHTGWLERTSGYFLMILG